MTPSPGFPRQAPAGRGARSRARVGFAAFAVSVFLGVALLAPTAVAERGESLDQWFASGSCHRRFDPDTTMPLWCQALLHVRLWTPGTCDAQQVCTFILNATGYGAAQTVGDLGVSVDAVLVGARDGVGACALILNSIRVGTDDGCPVLCTDEGVLMHVRCTGRARYFVALAPGSCMSLDVEAMVFYLGMTHVATARHNYAVCMDEDFRSYVHDKRSPPYA